MDVFVETIQGIIQDSGFMAMTWQQGVDVYKRQIHIHSEGHDENIVSLSDLDPKPEEENTSTALVRGIASRFQPVSYTHLESHAA